MTSTYIPIKEFLFERCVVDAMGCWNWTKSCVQNGYGHFGSQGKHYLAHVEAYKAYKGPIPEGLQVRHMCHNKKCINPGHLLLGTQQDNLADTIILNRELGQKRPSKPATMIHIAKLLAQLGTCAKLKVGCVLVDTRHRIIGSGFNGVPAGFQHCTGTACVGARMPKGSDTCISAHAEANALLNCKDPEQLYICYTTHAPCLRCVKTLLNTPCKELVFCYEEFEAPAKALWEQGGRKWTRLAV